MSQSETIEGVTLYGGDCLDVLPGFCANSFDSCVTDPPYHLTSITKRFGADNAAPAKVGKTGAYARASAGFMGKQWDGGDIAFQPETWAAVYRVLKPGAHLIAFSATRTYHRMACAIEDAGFEIRDSIQWLYGSGFPKSHDISKAIDSRGGKQVGWFGPWLKAWREENGIKQAEVAALFPSKSGGKTGCVANWELGFNLPTPEQFNTICQAFGLPFDSLEAAEREIVAQRTTGIGTGRGTVAIMGDGSRDITAPATDLAREWDGWGTALKPACEPIVLARKPLSESTIAANVLKWGTGAINVDGCRVDIVGDRRDPCGADGIVHRTTGNTYGEHAKSAGFDLTRGRWPANVIHDGSDEVVEAFPESGPSSDKPRHNGDFKSEAKGYEYAHTTFGHADNGGSAARFFYTAKADADDRLGSKHPTVKPVDLIQYLVRLVTPKGGLVLDPFAGTGTTGEACIRERMRAVLIEREPEYQEDIRRRLKLALAGPDERVREAAKAKNPNPDPGPLFSSAWDKMWAKPLHESNPEFES